VYIYNRLRICNFRGKNGIKPLSTATEKRRKESRQEESN